VNITPTSKLVKEMYLVWATSTVHYYVCVILLPVLTHTRYISLTSFEVGVMFTG